MARENDTFRILIEASQIPKGSVVTKATGTKRYRLVDELRIYGMPNVTSVPTFGGARFMIDEDGSATAVGGDTVLCWHVERDALVQFLVDPEADGDDEEEP